MRLRRCQRAHQCWALCVGRFLMCRVCAVLVFCGGEKPGALPSWDWAAMDPNCFSCLLQSKDSKTGMKLQRRKYQRLPDGTKLIYFVWKCWQRGPHECSSKCWPITKSCLCYCCCHGFLTIFFVIGVKYCNPFNPWNILPVFPLSAWLPTRFTERFLQLQHQGASWDTPPTWH